MFEDEIEEWILDTGTGNDLCQMDQRGVSSTGDPVLLETANGVVSTTSRTTVSLDILQEDCECIALVRSVRAISIGRRCAGHGYGFSWEPWADKPTLIRPDGTEVELECHDFVPYVKTASSRRRHDEVGDRRHVRCMPAPTTEIGEAETYVGEGLSAEGHQPAPGSDGARGGIVDDDGDLAAGLARIRGPPDGGNEAVAAEIGPACPCLDAVAGIRCDDTRSIRVGRCVELEGELADIDPSHVGGPGARDTHLASGRGAMYRPLVAERDLQVEIGADDGAVLDGSGWRTRTMTHDLQGGTTTHDILKNVDLAPGVAQADGGREHAMYSLLEARGAQYLRKRVPWIPGRVYDMGIVATCPSRSCETSLERVKSPDPATDHFGASVHEMDQAAARCDDTSGRAEMDDDSEFGPLAGYDLVPNTSTPSKIQVDDKCERFTRLAAVVLLLPGGPKILRIKGVS